MTRVEPPYFPDLTFGDEADSDAFMQQWFGKHLRSMNERRLHIEQERDSVRLLTLPTFHEPRLVRLDRHESNTQITAKRTDGRGGYGPGRLTINNTIHSGLSIFADATHLLDEINFWDLPALDDAVVLDGTRYVVESTIDGAYHVIERASPNKREKKLLKWLNSQAKQLFRENGG